jgi:hypothetical protein
MTKRAGITMTKAAALKKQAEQVAFYAQAWRMPEGPSK